MGNDFGISQDEIDKLLNPDGTGSSETAVKDIPALWKTYC